MKSPRVRRLAFELLEPKASPSAVLLVLAPLDEPAQRAIETERALYSPITTSSASRDANRALLEFIERHTHSPAQYSEALPLPTPAEVEAADRMMAATDADLRAMLIEEMLQASMASGESVVSIIQY